MTIVRAKRTTLIALLPALVLAACSSDNLKAENDQLRAQNQAYQQQIAALTAQQGRLQNSLRIVVNDDLAFKSGSWELSDEGMQTMARVAQQLAPYQQRPIAINGYTDNTPIGTGAPQRRHRQQRDAVGEAGRICNGISSPTWREAGYDDDQGLG